MPPSGDQEGWSSCAGSDVTWTACPPVTDITYTSHEPARLLAKATRVPSGLSDGITSCAGSAVNWVTVRPVTDLT